MRGVVVTALLALVLASPTTGAPTNPTPNTLSKDDSAALSAQQHATANPSNNATTNGGGPSPSDTFLGYVRGLGFDVSEHFATTADGYILRLFHIPGANASAPVVILQHGILASAWCWVDNTPTRAPALVLANLGFDVWFTNSRGNTFSRNHTTLKPTSKQFWDFTFADMGRFDVLANVEFVMGATGAKNVSFVGWSQGTTQMFISALSANNGTKLQSSINLFAALSPVTYLNHCDSQLLTVMSKFRLGEAVYTLYPYDFLPGSEAMSYLEETLCKLTFGELCKLSVDAICGTSDMDNAKAIEAFSAHFPDGTSTKDMLHYEQFVNQDVFREFDYGKEGNEQHYHRDTPPDYDLGQLEVPVALFAGSHDALVAAEDRERMESELPGANIVFSRVYDDFSHMTWFAGDDRAWYWFSDLVHVLLDAAKA